MNIADFFVTIGVKGKDDVKKSLTSVQEGLGDIKSMSLEAKAAIIGIMYGLEQIFSKSMQKGNAIEQFGQSTGQSMQALQNWQAAAMKTGNSAEEMASSIENAQKIMDRMTTGQGTPKGFAAISNSLMAAGRAPLDAALAQKDAMYEMNKLREYVQTTTDTPQRQNDWLESMGMGPGAIRTMRMAKGEIESFGKGLNYSDNQLAQLQKVSIAWSVMWAKIEKSFGNFTSKHGLQLTNQIGAIVVKLTDLISKFVELAEKLHVFEAIGKVFDGLTAVLDYFNESITRVSKDKEGLAAGLMKEDGRRLGQGAAFLQKIFDPKNDPTKRDAPQYIKDQMKEFVKDHAAPPVKGQNGASNISQDKNVNVVVNNTGLKNTGEGVVEYEKSINYAFRQLNSNFQVT